MVYGSRARACLAFLAALTVSACGSDTPSLPKPSYLQGTEVMSGPPIAPHSSICWPFDNAKAGPVSAEVTPAPVHVAVGAGSCSAPGPVIAEKDGAVVNVDAPAGSNHVTLSNGSDLDAPYTLRVTHWY
jgi:hypothetical protein